jgi:hypothetical protein
VKAGRPARVGRPVCIITVKKKKRKDCFPLEHVGMQEGRYMIHTLLPT